MHLPSAITLPFSNGFPLPPIFSWCARIFKPHSPTSPAFVFLSSFRTTVRLLLHLRPLRPSVYPTHHRQHQFFCA